jgi:hypothetical protein
MDVIVFKMLATSAAAAAGVCVLLQGVDRRGAAHV